MAAPPQKKNRGRKRKLPVVDHDETPAHDPTQVAPPTNSDSGVLGNAAGPVEPTPSLSRGKFDRPHNVEREYNLRLWLFTDLTPKHELPSSTDQVDQPQESDFNGKGNNRSTCHLKHIMTPFR